jgi:hypothetical protein
MRTLPVGLLLSLVACASQPVMRPAAAPRTETAKALPFIEDDYDRAVAEAKRRKVPLFVDTWAPW